MYLAFHHQLFIRLPLIALDWPNLPLLSLLTRAWPNLSLLASLIAELLHSCASLYNCSCFCSHHHSLTTEGFLLVGDPHYFIRSLASVIAHVYALIVTCSLSKAANTSRQLAGS